MTEAITIQSIFNQSFQETLNTKLSEGWEISSTNCGAYPEDTIEGFGEVWQAILIRHKESDNAN